MARETYRTEENGMSVAGNLPALIALIALIDLVVREGWPQGESSRGERE